MRRGEVTHRTLRAPTGIDAAAPTPSISNVLSTGFGPELPRTIRCHDNMCDPTGVLTPAGVVRLSTM